MSTSAPANGLIRAVLPKATVGLIVADGKVVDAAPYVRRTTIGRDARDVWREFARQAVDLQWLPDPPR